MSSVGDLTVNITADTNGLTSGMATTREQLDQTITHIERQEISWGSLATSVVEKLANIGVAVLDYVSSGERMAAAALQARSAIAFQAASTANLKAATIAAGAAESATAAATASLGAASALATPPTIGLAAAVNFLMSPIVLIGGALALAVAAFMYFSSSADEATQSSRKTSKATNDASTSFERGTVKLSEYADVGRRAAAAAEAHTTNMRELAQQAKDTGVSFESLVGQLSAVDIRSMTVKGSLIDDDTSKSLSGIAGMLGEVYAGMQNLQATLSQPFIDAKNAITGYIPTLLGLKPALDSVKTGVSRVRDAMNWMNDTAKGAVNSVQALAYQWKTGASDAAAAQYIKDGQAITERAARSEQAIRRMQAVSVGSKQFAQMMDEATASAKANTEAEHIRSITTTEGIEAEIRAFTKRAEAENIAAVAAMDAAKKRGASQEEIAALDKANEDRVKRNATTGGALATQKEGIETGKIKPIGMDAVESARKALADLTLGHDEAALAALRQKGASEQVVMELKNIQDQSNQFKQMQDNIKSASEAFKKMAEDSAALDQKGVDKITALKDEIDLLNGSATHAEIAMRELSRQGFSEEQIAEIGALTAEIDKLKEKPEKEKKTQKQGRDLPDLKASFAGSSEAASIMLRGVGGQGNKMEQIAGQQLAEQKKTTAAITKLEIPAMAVGVV